MFARPKPAAFAFSLITHGIILAWVASGPVREKPESFYAKVIAPHASKLIWYNFRDKLPDVTPTRVKSLTPPRAEIKTDSREIVAGSVDAPRARQFVWQPVPKLEMNKDLQSPNLLAIHPRAEPPAKPKLFVPPAEKPKPPVQTPATLAAAPDIDMARNVSVAGNPLGVQPVKVQPRNFVAPRAGSPIDKPVAALPDAPVVASVNPAAAPLPLASEPIRAAPRTFVAPAAGRRPSALGPPVPDAPALPESAANSAVSVAIVGLNPSANVPAPVPEGSRNAQFSAGPQPRANGTNGSAEGAILTVPGLMIRNGSADPKPALVARAAPTSTANLRAAVRTSLPGATPAGPRPQAIRLNHAPDPTLEGRDTYAMSVQMPNITSFSGSWLIWFAARQGESGAVAAISPPVPLHKVDPKYFPAAIAEHVEGKVRLAAVIGKDGKVDAVKILVHLDDRLDQSAQDAIGKWLFEPALRNGQPVDVDAVIEIPFRLAPKLPR